MKTLLHRRRHSLISKFSERKIDALLVTRPANWYYLAGFTGESGTLVVSQKGTSLITDSRFMLQGRAEMSGIRILQQKGSLFESVGQFLKDSRFRRVGFDPSQVTVGQLQSLRKAAGARVRWIPAVGRVEGLRMCKDASELAQMRRAAILASEVVQQAIGLLKPGIREHEVGAEIEYQMRKKGASGPAFETIVAFGERAALPHARPTAKRLRKNELVVLDLGVILGHYCSDITRTVYVGRAPKTHSDLVPGGFGGSDGSDRGGREGRGLRGRRLGGEASPGRVPPRPSLRSQHGPRAWTRSARGSQGGAGAEVAPRAGKRNHN